MWYKGGSGGGDMDSAVYDQNGNLIVDKAETLSGLLATIVELNYLSGVTNNIQTQIDAIPVGMKWLSEIDTYANMIASHPTSTQGSAIVVRADETQPGSPRTYYIYDEINGWEYIGLFDYLPDASSTLKGMIKLSGDLTGTADSPILVDTGIVAGQYINATVTFDSKGRAIAVETGLDDSLTSSTTKTYSIDKINSLLAEKQDKIFIEPIQPVGIDINDIWIDTSSSPYMMYIWDGTTMQPIGSSGGGGGSSTSDQVAYTNSGYPTLTNVQEALDKLLYVTPVISTFTLSPAIAEKGSTITTLTFNWTINKNITSQSINNTIGSIPPADRILSKTGLSLTANTTYQLTADDGTTTVNKSASIAFQQKRYWGVNSNTSLATSADVLALSGSEFSTTRVQSKTFNPSNQYIYFAFPATFGTPSFKVNGLANNAWIKSTISFTNASGFTEVYDVYRSQYSQTGSGIIVDIA